MAELKKTDWLYALDFAGGLCLIILGCLVLGTTTRHIALWTVTGLLLFLLGTALILLDGLHLLDNAHYARLILRIVAGLGITAYLIAGPIFGMLGGECPR